MTLTGTVALDFDPRFAPRPDTKLRDDLSGVVRIGDTLWLANDESVGLERLTRSGDGFAAHAHFPLADFLRLPAPPRPGEETEEADVEGLAFDGDHLWLVGSHGLKRKKPQAGESAAKNAKRLAKVTADGNRFLLARVPVDRAGVPALKKNLVRGGKTLTAAQLRGDKQGSDLTEALADDEHFGPFLALPGKDNGFDVEGLAVADGRLLIGLRGPVLRGWAAVLEVEPEPTPSDPTTLELKAIGPDGRRYRKHFLYMNGLGMRDLCVQGDDLLLLAGPAQDLDGPVMVYRWPGGAKPAAEGFVFADGLRPVLRIPRGSGVPDGADHPEGLTPFGTSSGGEALALVVYDSPASARLRGEQGVAADVFRL